MNSIQITSEQKVKLLEMCNKLFPEYKNIKTKHKGDNGESFSITLAATIATILLAILGVTTNLLTNFLNHYIAFTFLSVLISVLILTMTWGITMMLFYKGHKEYDDVGRAWLLNPSDDMAYESANNSSIIVSLYRGLSERKTPYSYSNYLRLKKKEKNEKKA